MARKVDEPWTKCRNPTDFDWTRASAHDGRDPRSWPQTKPCRGEHVLEQCYTANQRGSVVRDVPFVYITFLVTLLE